MARQREGATTAMTGRWGAILAVVLLSLAGADPALGDVATVRIVAPADLAALPLVVAAHGHLIEQQAEARGLPGVTVQWLTPNGGNPIEQLLNGQADIVATTDIVGFLLAWDERSGTPQEIRGLAALAQMPYQLLSRNPAIHTIRDFTSKDRIAVPAVKTSLPAVMLEMAASDEWGAPHYDRLDPLTVTLGSDAADSALHSDKGDIDTDFSRMPYADDERGDPAIHRVMDSFDIAGPHSIALVIASAQFRDANPALCAAVVGAISDADTFIKASRGAAAEIYDAAEKSDDIPVEDLSDMLGDPDTAFSAAPTGIQRIAGFLHRTGRLRHDPDSWQLLFFPEIYKQPGS
jgi:NitT/TauT family transport system substrate-binding protein